MPRLVLFDLDGTLISSHGAGVRAMTRAGARLWGEGFHLDGTTIAGGLDGDLFAAAARNAGIDASPTNRARFLHAYQRELPAELRRSGLRVLPGVRQLLDRMHAHPAVTLGLLTGNFVRTAPIKLAAADLDSARFQISVFGDEGRSRPDLVRLALRRYEALHGRPIAPEHVMVVGDTPRDIAAALAHRCLSVGVATGPYDEATLQAAGATLALPDLSHPQPLWNLLNANDLEH